LGRDGSRADRGYGTPASFLRASARVAVRKVLACPAQIGGEDACGPASLSPASLPPDDHFDPLRRLAAQAQEPGLAADGADGADAQAGGLEQPRDLAPAKTGDAGQGLAGGAEQGAGALRLAAGSAKPARASPTISRPKAARP